MQPESLLSVQTFCTYYHVELEFVQTLEQRGLIQTVTFEETLYIDPEQVGQLEKFVRLHQDLAIHADDLDVVSELLERIDGLQQQVTQLQNRLAFYES